jgi:class 3 adenylate cyclase
MEPRLAAILAADFVGYSRLTGADEGGTLAALRRLRAEVAVSARMFSQTLARIARLRAPPVPA